MIIITLQKEVGERICAKAPDATYLSSFVQTFFEVEYLKTVPKTVFDPVPQVDGAVIKFSRREAPIPNDLIHKYEGFLHKGFSNPRKMLNKVFRKEELERVNVDATLRPQNVDWEKWVEMFKALVIVQ